MELETYKIAKEYGAWFDAVPRAGWGFTFKTYPDGSIQGVGTYSADGHYSRKKRKKPTLERAKNRQEMTDQDFERSIKRSRITLKDKVRMLGADQIITCTTRAAIVDAEIFRQIISKFNRTIRSELNEFKYVSVMERHMSDKTSFKKFGSLHLHIAVAGRIDYNLLRHAWRKAVQDVLKNDDYEGANINGSRNQYNSKTSTRYIAQYIAKYLTKDIDNEYYETNKRRYWSSKNIPQPIKTRIYTTTASSIYIFIDMFSDIFNIDFKQHFCPTIRNGIDRPVIWLST